MQGMKRTIYFYISRRKILWYEKEAADVGRVSVSGHGGL